MKTENFCSPAFRDIPVVMTIGVFDGLHIGHMKIISECVKTAHELDAKSVVVTFNVNPKMVCGSEKQAEDIISPSEFDDILTHAGIDYHCVIDFSRNISKLTGEEFVALVCTSYNLKAMVVGRDFRCGTTSDAAGTEQISEFLAKYTSSALLKVVEPVLLNGEKVSSSLIRRCLLTGDSEKASELLGRPLNLRRSQNGC